MKLSRAERETIITYNATSNNAEIYTADKKVMKKIDEYVKLYPSAYSVISKTKTAKIYSVPKKYVKIIRPRNISNTQREKARKRIANINSRLE